MLAMRSQVLHNVKPLKMLTRPLGKLLSRFRLILNINPLMMIHDYGRRTARYVRLEL
jgi:hypothetical protein